MSSVLECHEHDACDQHSLLANEGESAVLDPEGLPIQRCVRVPGTQPFLSILRSADFLPFSFSEGGVCKIQGHALGTSGAQGPEGHQSLLSADADCS